MAKLIFATGNKGKLLEAKEILGIAVEGTSLEIDEIQSIDPIEVAVKKAKAYYQKLKKPIFVEDNAFFFEGLNNLPSTYIDSFSKVLGNNGLVDLLRGRKDRKATAQATIVYVDKKGKEHVFIGKVKGKIASKAKGDKGFGWDPIFIPKGSTKTFGQMELKEKNKYSMRKKALVKLKKWLAAEV